jgi:hypothetical protein
MNAIKLCRFKDLLENPWFLPEMVMILTVISMVDVSLHHSKDKKYGAECKKKKVTFTRVYPKFQD